ncbi:hypothetical protein ACVWZK_001102 [Bradyrhizobium sp. GM0.4]
MPAEDAADQCNCNREQQADCERRADDELDPALLARTIGLADQHRGAGAQPHDEGEKEEHHRKEHRDRCKRVDPDHLAEIDVADGAEQ